VFVALHKTVGYVPQPEEVPDQFLSKARKSITTLPAKSVLSGRCVFSTETRDFVLSMRSGRVKLLALAYIQPG
jgi:hypothetical protein